MPNTTENSTGTYSKSALVKAISEETGRTVVDIKPIVDSLFLQITKAVDEGKRIEIRKFGVFFPNVRKERTRVNPKTGKYLPYKTKCTVLGFKVSRLLRREEKVY